MYRLLYSSVAVTALNEFELEALLGVSRANNEADGITGCLLHITAPETGDGAFLQVLEGESAWVNRAYARIVADDLHRDPEILAAGPVAGRVFGDWSMRLEEVASGRSLSDIRDRDAMERLLTSFAPA